MGSANKFEWIIERDASGSGVIFDDVLRQRNGSNPARAHILVWHVSSAPRFSPYQLLTSKKRSLRLANL